MVQAQESVPTQEDVDLLKQQLLQAQRLSSLGALAASVAHEFNNILTTIINYSKLALADQDDAKRTKALQKILTAGQRAAQITGGMLGFARGQVEQRTAVDMVVLVKEVLVLVEKDLSKHRVKLETRFDGHPNAVVSAAQIQQIILNLMINSRQAMPDGGRLRVEVRENLETNMVEIVVADSGVGIPADQLRHIFDAFYTTKEGPDESGKGGTGIGLAVCREIIEAHNGRIRVESLLGRGTTFIVKLPSAPLTEQIVV